MWGREEEARRFAEKAKPDERIPPTAWEGLVDLGDEPDSSLEKILSLTKKIISHEHNSWPPDEWWDKNTPGWILGKNIKKLTEAEALENLELWRTDPSVELPWGFFFMD